MGRKLRRHIRMYSECNGLMKNTFQEEDVWVENQSISNGPDET